MGESQAMRDLMDDVEEFRRQRDQARRIARMYRDAYAVSHWPGLTPSDVVGMMRLPWEDQNE